jgi:hemolysin activation/secretion protein
MEGFLMNGAMARNNPNNGLMPKNGSQSTIQKAGPIGLLAVTFLFMFMPGVSLIKESRAAEAPSPLIMSSAGSTATTLPGTVSPEFGPLSSPSVPTQPPRPILFRHDKRLTILPGNPKRSVLFYVAHRLFPHPDVPLKESIAVAIDRIDRESTFSFKTEKTSWHGRPALFVTIDRKTLNRMAGRIHRTVETHPVLQKIRHIWLVGVPPQDRIFVMRNLGVNPGDPVATEPLSGHLYALSQVPGFSRIDALFVPQPLTGENDLIVKEIPQALWSGSQIEVDNYGYAAVGQLTVNGTLSLLDTLLSGDQFTLSASTAPFGTIFFGMNAGTLSYSAPLDFSNRLGLDINAMNYQLGGGWSPWGHGATTAQLVALGLSGSNEGIDGWGSHAFLQSSTANLSIKGLVFLKEFQDTYSPSVQNDRSLVGGTLDLSGAKRAGRISANIEIADTLYSLTQGSGSSPFNPFYTSTPGLRNYLTGNGAIRIALSEPCSLLLSTVDQQFFGEGSLDPMLQGVLGGMSNIRALPTAALFGNDLYTGSVAFIRSDRIRGGRLDSSLFFDAGQVVGIGTNDSAMGPGIEESWTGEHLFGKADLAVPVGPLSENTLGSPIVAVTGGNIQAGALPLQLWLSMGWRY